MATATIGGLDFRLDPQSIQWSYSIKTASTDTVGGKVVQVFGVNPGDLRVSGSLGNAGQQAHLNFVNNMEYLAVQQAETLDPIEFSFPVRGWKFQVYIKSVSSPDSQQGVRLAPEISNPRFTLVLNVVEENTDLSKVATDKFLARLTEGIGWVPNEYNGVVDYDELRQIFAGNAEPATPIVMDTSGGPS